MSGWTVLREAARQPVLDLMLAIRDPAMAQQRLLARIVEENARTEFGVSHGFGSVRSLADYRTAVPVRTHDAFRPLIARVANGEPAILTQAPVIAFEETGGTAAGSKLIPYTAAGLAGFRAAVLPWLADQVRRRPGILAGSTYVAISPATRPPRRTPSGIPVGLPSDAAFLGDDLIAPFMAIMAVPPDVSMVADVEDWRVATLIHLIERDDLTFVSVWSPTFFLDLIESLTPRVDVVARRLSSPARARLASALATSGFDTTCLWPRLDAISCWTDAGSASFAHRLKSLFPQAAIEPKGLLATEAAITLPWGDAVGAIPALTSTVIEFIDASGCARLAHELQAGQAYRVVLTTAAGLYRYDMGDQVQCVTNERSLPRLLFQGRAGLVSDMVGEKLSDAFVSGALALLPVAAALAPSRIPKPHYELWLDSPQTPAVWSQIVEAALCVNPQYAYARRIGQLDPLEARALPGFAAKQALQRARSGQRLGDVKPVSLLLAAESRF